MTVAVKGAVAELIGTVTVEEAEQLAAWLRTTSGPKVGVRRLTSLHTAALQALLAARPRIVGVPADLFLSTHVLPLLREPVAATPAEGTAP